MRILLISALLFSPPMVFAGKLKGKLKTDTPSDYKVVVINKNSSSKVSNVSSSGSFRAKVKKGSSLHIVSKSGKYVGPIVSVNGSKAFATTTGESGSIGRVKLKDGYAKVSYKNTSTFFKKKPSISFDSAPLGAGNYGLVSVAQRAKIAADDPQLGEDLDRDGIPDVLDIDDDGDLNLDIVDEVSHAQSEFNAEIASTLRLGLSDSLNVNTGSFTEEQVETLVRDNLFLLMLLQSNSSETISSVDVDCGNLSYCSSNGTATISMDNPPITNGSLWTAYDPEGNGFPNLYLRTGFMPEINLKPGATRSEIGTGDTIFFRISTSGGQRIIPAVLPFVFATSPAIKSYTDNLTTTQISYPVASTGAGTQTSPITLSTQSVGLTFWKPQRAAIDGAEAPGYIDMGGLRYGVYLTAEGSMETITCRPEDYSNLSSSLEARTESTDAQSLQDNSADEASNTNNTLSFTLDLGACLTRESITPTGIDVMIDLVATSQSQDQTSQSIFFELP